MKRIALNVFLLLAIQVLPVKRDNPGGERADHLCYRADAAASASGLAAFLQQLSLRRNPMALV